MKKSSELETEFALSWRACNPDIKLESEITKLIPKKQYRFDFGHLETKVLIEVNGGIYQKMGHSTGKGITRDYEKNNLAILQGYVVFQLSKGMITVDLLKEIGQFIKGRINAST